MKKKSLSLLSFFIFSASCSYGMYGEKDRRSRVHSLRKKNPSDNGNVSNSEGVFEQDVFSNSNGSERYSPRTVHLLKKSKEAAQKTDKAVNGIQKSISSLETEIREARKDIISLVELWSKTNNKLNILVDADTRFIVPKKGLEVKCDSDQHTKTEEPEGEQVSELKGQFVLMWNRIEQLTKQVESLGVMKNNK